MAINLKSELSIIEELEWADYITQQKELRKIKCQKLSKHLRRQAKGKRVTTWTPAYPRISTDPNNEKVLAGHSVVNRSALTAKEHIELLSIPKRIRENYHCLKPIKKFIPPCTPRVLELSMPKRNHIFCTWTNYYDKLAPSKIDRLHELLTFKTPTLPVADGSPYFKHFRKRKYRTYRSKPRNQELGVLLWRISGCLAIAMCRSLFFLRYRHLNDSQRKIACHIKLNLEKHNMLPENDDPNIAKCLCNPINFCAVVVSDILLTIVAFDGIHCTHKTADSSVISSYVTKMSYQGSKEGDDSSGDDDDDDDENSDFVDALNDDNTNQENSNKHKHKHPDVSNPETVPVENVTSRSEKSTISKQHDHSELHSSGASEDTTKSIPKYEKSLEDIIEEDSASVEPMKLQLGNLTVEENKAVEYLKRGIVADVQHITINKGVTSIVTTITSTTSKMTYDDSTCNTRSIDDYSTTHDSDLTPYISTPNDELSSVFNAMCRKSALFSKKLIEVNIMPHTPDTVCCASVKAWARFLGEVAEISKTWCYWITKTIKTMREMAHILRGDGRRCKANLLPIDPCKWTQFFQKLDCDIAKWRTYNNHVQVISEKIVSYYRDKRVECCNLCKEEFYDFGNLTVKHHVCCQLMEALNASKYWREWLGEMVDECESLTKLLTKDNGSLMEMKIPPIGNIKHKCHIEPLRQGSIYSISEIDL